MEDQLRRVTQVAREAAQQMLKNGGEIYRVEEIVRRIGQAYGYEAEVIAFTTGLVMTLTDARGEQTCSRIGRVHTRTVDLTLLARVNELSRALCEGRMDLDAAEKELRALDRLKSLPIWAVTVLAGGSSAFFALMFGGRWFEFLAAGLCAGLVKLACALLPSQETPLTCLISGFLTAFLGRGVAQLFGLGNVDCIIISTLMPFLPGLSFTNAIRDSMNGDLISGSARIGDALTQAVILAGGVGAGLWVWARLMGGAL